MRGRERGGKKEREREGEKEKKGEKEEREGREKSERREREKEKFLTVIRDLTEGKEKQALQNKQANE